MSTVAGPCCVAKGEEAFFSVNEGTTPSPVADYHAFSRPMGTMEAFFRDLGDVGASVGREHVLMYSILQIRFPSGVTDVEDQIAGAWEEVGQLFPALRAEVDSPDKSDHQKRPTVTVRPFEQCNFRNTFSSHPNCPNVDALFHTTQQGWSSTATCHWLPAPGQLIVRTSHWRSDGFGLIMLSDVLLSRLANRVQGALGNPVGSDLTPQSLEPWLNPSLEDLIRKHLRYSPCDAAAADRLVDTLAHGGRSIVLPTRSGSDTAMPTTCSRTAIRISAASSEELFCVCRSQNFSVTSALNAAIIRATARFPQDPEADSYAIFAPVDLRGPLIEAGALECLQPTGVYLSGLPLRIEGVVKHLENGNSIPAKSFDTLALELSAFYSPNVMQYKKPGEAESETADLLQLAEPYMERITKLFSSFSLPGCPHQRTPVISSLGKMDAFIKSEYPVDKDNTTAMSKLCVTDFWMACDNATPMMTLHPWSWEGELTLSAAWNDSYYSRETAVAILENTFKELSEGLNMNQISYRIVNGCCDTSRTKGLSD